MARGWYGAKTSWKTKSGSEKSPNLVYIFIRYCIYFSIIFSYTCKIWISLKQLNPYETKYISAWHDAVHCSSSYAVAGPLLIEADPFCLPQFSWIRNFHLCFCSSSTRFPLNFSMSGYVSCSTLQFHCNKFTIVEDSEDCKLGQFWDTHNEAVEYQWIWRHWRHCHATVPWSAQHHRTAVLDDQ